MHRRLASHRRRAALISIGLVAAASVGTLRTLSVAEARGTEPRGAQASKKTPARRPTAKPAAAKPATAAAQQAPDGKQVYAMTCAACHQATGLGVEGTYPPLAASEWAQGDDGKLVRIILHGLTGPVEVAGETYSGAMPPWGGVLKDPDVAAVATYIRGAWGNHAAPVTTARVASIRSATAARKAPWTAPELAQLPAGK
ncbi:MAG: cytochrome c subunit of cbb3 type cytochrome oxidase [Gemmatimonadetes bacterium]|nr:cytochrome c subunit of cbb3 type cytochrome oxidase [Gemmatimonadota bacterium]